MDIISLLHRTITSYDIRFIFGNFFKDEHVTNDNDSGYRHDHNHDDNNYAARVLKTHWMILWIRICSSCAEFVENSRTLFKKLSLEWT